MLGRVRASIGELAFVEVDTGDIPCDLREADSDLAGPAPHVDDPVPIADRREHEVRVLCGAPASHETLESQRPAPLEKGA